MAVTAVRMDEEQPGAVFSADAALDSECSNARQKTVGKGAAKIKKAYHKAQAAPDKWFAGSPQYAE